MARSPRFDARWQRRRRWQARWRGLRWWLALAVLLAITAWIARWPTMGGQWDEASGHYALCGEGRGPCVIDGDTLAIGNRRIRMVGYDAPELHGECDAERRLAELAREALRDWLNRGPFLMDGGADPPRDDYGRELRSLRRSGAGGQDEWLAETMIAAGLGRARRDGPGWCAN